MLNGIMLSAVILSNVLPSVTEPSVVVLNVVAPLRHSKVVSIVTFNFEFYYFHWTLFNFDLRGGIQKTSYDNLTTKSQPKML
jgi:hypothetical protein